MFCGEVFEEAEDCFFKFQTLLPENGKKKRRKEQLIAHSDEVESVDIIFFFS